jgi:hypothetical protein
LAWSDANKKFRRAARIADAVLVEEILVRSSRPSGARAFCGSRRKRLFQPSRSHGGINLGRERLHAETPRFLYGPRFVGFGSAASISFTISPISQSVLLTPPAIAGDVRSVELIDDNVLANRVRRDVVDISARRLATLQDASGTEQEGTASLNMATGKDELAFVARPLEA